MVGWVDIGHSILTTLATLDILNFGVVKHFQGNSNFVKRQSNIARLVDVCSVTLVHVVTFNFELVL